VRSRARDGRRQHAQRDVPPGGRFEFEIGVKQ
jgi:hypothetical protein